MNRFHSLKIIFVEMDKHQKKIVAEALRNLKWDFIMAALGDDYKIKGKPFSKDKHTKESIKKELEDILAYMIASSIEVIELDCWIIKWNTVFTRTTGISSAPKECQRLEIIFVPHRSIIREDDILDDVEMAPTNLELDTQEQQALIKILKQAEADENYELCHSIHTRLKKLDKILKKHDTKKHKECREVRTRA